MEIKKTPQVENEDGLKMYCCTMEAEFSMIVMADSKESAERIAKENADEEFRNLPFDDQFYMTGFRPITSKEEIPREWLVGDPYYEDHVDERPVEAIVDAWQERQKRK